MALVRPFHAGSNKGLDGGINISNALKVQHSVKWISPVREVKRAVWKLAELCELQTKRQQAEQLTETVQYIPHI